MATERARGLQDTFLERVRQERTPLTVFLANGVRLQGFIADFDSFCLLLQRDDQLQLVYKHAVSTVVPLQQVGLYEPAEDRPQAPPEQPRPLIVERKSRPRV